MAGYTEFKIEAEHDHTVFRVLVKGLFGWKSAFVYTRYFSIGYDSFDEAVSAIEKYKNRFTKY